MRRTARLRQICCGGASHAPGSNRDVADYGDDFFKRSLQFAYSCYYHHQSGSERHIAEQGRQEKIGFKRSVETWLLGIDAVASLLASVRSADRRNSDLSQPSITMAIDARSRPNSLGKPTGFAPNLLGDRRTLARVEKYSLAFTFCSRSAGTAYSRVARIFESNRDGNSLHSLKTMFSIQGSMNSLPAHLS